MGVNKYAGTFPMASFNKKTCNHREKKRGIKKYKNTQFFSIKQLRITRLRKHPIDPKLILSAVIGLENQFSVYLRVAVLHRFYCFKYGTVHCVL